MYLYTTWANRKKERYCTLEMQTVWALLDKDVKNKEKILKYKKEDICD